MMTLGRSDAMAPRGEIAPNDRSAAQMVISVH